MTQIASALLRAPVQYPSGRDLALADRVIYVLHQRFRYTYDAPVRDLDHRLVVIPPQQHGDQRRRLQSVTVSAEGALITNRRDSAGNTVTRVRVPLVPGYVEFLLDAVVERSGPASGAVLPAATLSDPRLLRPTRLTAADPAIRDLAADRQPAAILYCGDDLGDRPAFEAVRELRAAGTPGLLVVSGSAEVPELAAGADLVVDGPAGVAALLAALADAYAGS